jgi:hypothetical protein
VQLAARAVGLRDQRVVWEEAGMGTCCVNTHTVSVGNETPSVTSKAMCHVVILHYLGSAGKPFD